MKNKKILYTKLKIFHFKDKLDSLVKENSKILSPLHIRIKPTNTCQHNCSYCAYKTDDLQLGQDMSKKDFIPRDKMFEIIDDLVEMGVKAVTFSGGGEPFCYPHILETIKKLSKTSIKFSALTNGSLLEGEIAEIFAKNATWLRVSMDGWDEESYAEYRGVKKDEFPKIMKNMEDFKRIKGNCYLGVVIIVDKYNANHIFDFIEKLKKIKIDSVKVSPCVISNSAEKNKKYHKSLLDLIKCQINRASEEFADDSFEIYDSYHELEDGFEKKYKWCPYLQILPVIGADLNIYPCQDKAYNLADGLIGTIKDKRFKDFWFSSKDKFFKINPTLVCNHHCVADAKNRMILEYLNADREHLDFV